MKRSPFPPPDPAKRLSRRVPLKSTGGLGQGSGPVRQARIRQVSVKAAEKPRRQAKDAGPSRKVRKLVLERDGYACVRCGVSVLGRRYSLAHRVRASQGGKAVPVNLLTVCGLGGELCHGAIDLYKDPADAEKGYRLPSMTDGKPTDPALFPVMLFSPRGSGITAWLTPDGRYAFEPPPGQVAA